jgi:endonuclease YncB( thermonuclease family)
MLRHILVLGLLLQAAPLLADTLAGRVSSISDGATLTVVDIANVRHNIRLAAIDAPESRQPYGRESKQHLSALVLGKEVKVEWRKQDRYGRIVGKLTLQSPPCATCTKTLDAGLAQLEAGLAWWDRETRREQSLPDQGYYEYAEFDAKARRIGLWQDEAPIPPWEWRKKNRIVAGLNTVTGVFAREEGTARRASGNNSL